MQICIILLYDEEKRNNYLFRFTTEGAKLELPYRVTYRLFEHKTYFIYNDCLLKRLGLRDVDLNKELSVFLGITAVFFIRLGI